jgi:hypothetical protein
MGGLLGVEYRGRVAALGAIAASTRLRRRPVGRRYRAMVRVANA